MRLCLALPLAALCLGACAGATDRETAIVGAMVRADGPLLRSRPALVAGKYARMARLDEGREGLYDYYRGEAPVFRADLADARRPLAQTRFPAALPLPFSMGDAHPENFGILVDAAGVPALEPNDLDAADRLPYYFDLRRLTVGLVLAVRASNADDEAARRAAVAAEGDVVRACARGYRDAIHELASGAPLERFTSDGGSANVADLFARSAAGRTTTLSSLTTLDAEGHRHLLRGPLDPADREQVLVPLAEPALEALPGLLDRARHAMSPPLAAEALAVLDAARLLGSGVASWPRVRILVLVRGASDAPADDLVLEVKELGDSGAPAVVPPFRPADDAAARIELARSLVWAVPDADPHWVAVPSFLGMPVQVRSETDAHPTLRVRRLHDELGTVPELEALARVLGALLARVTARSLAGDRAPAMAIDAALARDPEGFVEDEVVVAIDEADGIEEDFESFRDALDHLGPTLGVRSDPADAPSPDLQALFCVPPVVPTPGAYR